MKHLPIDAQKRADNLHTVSFAQLLIELYEADENGTLLVFDKDEGLRAAIHFAGGRPVAALAEHDARDLQTMLIPLCAWTDGRFEFTPGVDHVGDDGLRASSPIDPLRLITAAARGPLREDVVEQTMRLIGENAMRLAQRLDVKRYAFSAQETMVLTALDAAPLAIDELRAKLQVSERVLRRVLYVLLLTRAISLQPPERRMISGTLFNARALAGQPSSAPPGPRGQRPTVPVMPSVDPAAAAMPSRRPSTPGITAERAAKPPTRTVPPDWRPTSMSPAAHSSLPYAVQSPENGVTALQPGASTPPAAPSAPSETPRPSRPVPTELRAQREQAEALWQRAEMLAKRGDHDVALVTARSALKLGNTPPEREALLGWLIYLHGGSGTRIHPHVWKCLNHALQRDPLCEEALYYKAVLLSRTGKIEQAHAHFARVLLLNPKHVEAEREVRIIEMRRSHASQQSGFLRRLLTGRPPATKSEPKE
jgi:hypothetical protein